MNVNIFYGNREQIVFSIFDKNDLLNYSILHRVLVLIDQIMF